MRAYRVRRRRLRLGIVSALLTGFLIGCGGITSAPGANSSVDPKAGARRKEMADFSKNQPPDDTK